MPPVPPSFRRRFTITIDDRSNEVGWIFGSKVFRSRVEAGRFGSWYQRDLAVPYNTGKPLMGWTVELPQYHKGIPHDGKLLRLNAPDGNYLLLEFHYEATGVPGALYCELLATLNKETANHAKEERTVKAHVPAQSDSGRRERQAV